ncbi:unnamed protein product [Closterium sp. NIES-54]
MDFFFDSTNDYQPPSEFFVGKVCDGNVTGDPHFVGADKSRFDFSGQPGENFALISDAHIAVTAYFGGRVEKEWMGQKNKVMTWMRNIAILWGHHSVVFEARPGPDSEYGAGYLKAIYVDGEKTSLSFPGEKMYLFDGSVEMKWVDARKKVGDDLVDIYEITVAEIITLRLILRPEIKLMRTKDDGLVHFTIEVVSAQLSANVHGVLGQTYRPDFAGRLPPCTPPSVQTVQSSRSVQPEGREYLPDMDHAVFKHFSIIKRVEGKAQQYECKYCFNVFTNAAIRCAQHLSSWKGMKRREVTLCKEAPQDVRKKMRTKYEKLAAANEEKRRATSAAVAAVQAGSGKRHITDYFEGDAAAAKPDAHEGLALMFAACRIPEITINHPLFVNAMLLVNRAGPGYGPMGIKTSWKKTGVTIASDMMKDKCGRAQANVLLINDSGTVFKEAIDCSMKRKTGGYVAGILQPMVEEVGPENVVAFCMDGGSNYAVAVQELIAKWPHIQQVPCATHVMDLLQEAVGKMGWAKGVVDRTEEMISFVRSHHWTRAYLRTPELLRSTLNAMVLTDRWEEWAVGSRKEAAETFAVRVLDAAWWRTAEFFCKLMKLPYKAIRQTDADAKGMMGRLYDVMLQLSEDVNNLLNEDEQQLSSTDKVQICRIIKNCWDNKLDCAMHAAGRILNPANQEEDIFGSDAECTRDSKAFINQHVEFLIGHDGKGREEGLDYLLALGDGLRAFLDLKGSFGMPEALAQREKVKAGKYSMVKWWQWNGTDAPYLMSLAVRVLSQPVSASPCERGWGTWDAVHTARRNRLGSAKCQDLVFVAHNWNVVRNWHSRADVMPNLVPGIGDEPSIPEGYNGLDEMEVEEEEGEDDVLEDEYA